MPSQIENLQTASNNISAQLAAMTLNPKPNYSINGQTISWQSLFDSLVKNQQSINNLLIIAQGPSEYVVEGAT